MGRRAREELEAGFHWRFLKPFSSRKKYVEKQPLFSVSQHAALIIGPGTVKNELPGLLFNKPSSETTENNFPTTSTFLERARKKGAEFGKTFSSAAEENRYGTVCMFVLRYVTCFPFFGGWCTFPCHLLLFICLVNSRPPRAKGDVFTRTS